MENNCHDGHRLRLKERACKYGIDSLADHEVLELLLFFVIPYKNTNEIAHRLLNRFGSLSGVMEAPYEELVKIDGIGPHAATFISLLSQFFRRYEVDKHKNLTVYDRSMIEESVRNHFIGYAGEHVELFLFDSAMHMTDHLTVYEGGLSRSTVTPEKLGEFIFTSRASSFVLAHNHLKGEPGPSEEDLYVTRELMHTFSHMNRPMTEHFVVSDDGCIGILEKAHEIYD